MTRRLAVPLLGLTLALSASASASASFTRHKVPFGRYQLNAREYAGAGPAIVLMHGFPDDLHLYDRLVPKLRGRRVITFDFLGWGASDKPRGHTYTFAEQGAELDAVVRFFKLDQAIPVAHDASGPAAIDWSLAHPEKVAALVLLNTFYGVTPTLNAPEAIRIFSDPVFKDLAAGIAADPVANEWLFRWQVGRFMSDRRIRARFLDTLYRDFYPAEVPAFASLNRDLAAAVTANTARVGEQRAFTAPVRIIFGDRDPYLNAGVAKTLHEQFPTSDLFLLPARHYVQVDAPARVAELIRGVALAPR